MSSTKQKAKPAPETEVEEMDPAAAKNAAERAETDKAVNEESTDKAETKGSDKSPEPSGKDGDPVAEAEETRGQLLRLRADFENFRKRTRREKEEWTQRCLENLCGDLLTVLDHYDLGLENATDIGDETLKGFQMVRDQLGSTLGKYGLSPIVVDGGAFDPNEHEAITHMPSTEVPEGEVVAMTRKGYRLGQRLLRPAQVVVSAGGDAAEAPPADSGDASDGEED